jgi:polysaccharide export outer membrane protein
MKGWGKTGIVLVAAMLNACAMAPGLKMTEPAEVEQGTVVRVQPITLDLLNRMEAEREMRVRHVAKELAIEPQGYVIGKGDVLQILVWDHPELTTPAGQFRDAETSGQLVGEDGYIYYPYAGNVKAAGLKVEALRDVLTERLSTYIANPQLDVRVVGFRSKRVYVVGAVTNPGVLPINDVPMTIVDAINLSGGLSPDAHKSGVNISREGKTYEIDLKALYDFADSSQNLMLQHGDIVNVLDRSQERAFVMGEVRNPGAVEIVNSDLSLSAAIGEVGGFNQTTADPGHIYVIRGADNARPEIFHLDAQYASGMILAERFEIQAQDIIFVDTAGISQWNRVITQLLPSISLINFADNLGSN